MVDAILLDVVKVIDNKGAHTDEEERCRAQEAGADIMSPCKARQEK
jgi:hypothetical protein